MGVMTKEQLAAGTVHHRFAGANGPARDICGFDESLYPWMARVPLLPSPRAGNGPSSAPETARVAGVPVCFRLHKSGAVSDVRLVGRVARVRSNFGFLAHELFPRNVYFRFCDVDASSWVRQFLAAPGNPAPAAALVPASASALRILPGTLVAFRVAAKDTRIWALRVWRVPDNWARGAARAVAKDWPGGRAGVPNAQQSTPCADHADKCARAAHLRREWGGVGWLGNGCGFQPTPFTGLAGCLPVTEK